MGYRQAVRHSTLTAAFTSSNLVSPARYYTSKFNIIYEILAQLVEHLTFNQVVEGSIPSCLIESTVYLIYSVGGAFFHAFVL